MLVSVVDQLGPGGVGYIWLFSEGSHDEEWRHSVAPIPAEKLAEATEAMDDELELAPNGSILPPSENLKLDYSEEDDIEDFRDESIDFEKEVKVVN